MFEFSLSLAGILVHFSATFTGTVDYLSGFDGKYEEEIQRVIRVTGNDYQKYGLLNQDGRPGPADEVQIMAYLASNALLAHDSVIFHGVAFKWGGEVWILTAPSGTGKTTQYLNWIHTFPDEIEIINGDKPILRCREDGFIVHPSPWKGKEGFGSRETGMLSGIICLEQDTENTFRRLGAGEAVVPVLKQFITFMEDDEHIDKVIELEGRLLESVPVFVFRNTGDILSTAFLRRSLAEYRISKENGDVNGT